MRETSHTSALGDLHTTLRALVHLHTVDLLYADRYLHRAELLLPSLCSAEQYAELHRQQEELPDLRARLREATGQGDWPTVHRLAEAAAAVTGHLTRHAQILPIATAVFGRRWLHADPVALALNGVVAQPSSALLRERETIRDELTWLRAHDPEWRPFYAARLTYFEQLQLHHVDAPHPSLDDGHLRDRILDAIERSDFAQVERLTHALATEHNGTPAHLCAPPVAGERIHALAAAFPPQAVTRAAAMGCSMEMLPALRNLNEYIGAGGPEPVITAPAPARQDLLADEQPTEGNSPPFDLSATLRENLDLLLAHPFISSGGLRYLPWFGPETVLVETFPEAEPDAATPLLQALGLARRRGVPRLAVEHALFSSGPRICTALGLDPTEFALACIPFDVYHRLAARHGWGQREMWTHFDGYEVTHDLHLWGLVGGHANYGGPDDLSIVARDYESDRVTLRLTILRRERFLVRDAPVTRTAAHTLPRAFRSPAHARGS